MVAKHFFAGKKLIPTDIYRISTTIMILVTSVFPGETCYLLQSPTLQGVILESTFCGSYAPGALPPEEPPKDRADAQSRVKVVNFSRLKDWKVL